MKTRLLKKVRKRYTIERYYDGFYIGDDFNEGDWIILIDKQCEHLFLTFQIMDNFEATYKIALEHLIALILSDYKHLGIRRKKKITKPETLWYNTKTKTT